MTVVANVRYVDPLLTEHFEGLGHEVYVGRRTTAIDLKLEAEQPGYRLYGLPHGLDAARIDMHCSEQGGSGAEEATVVCFVSGGRIQPFWIVRHPKPNGAHAWFSMSRDVVTVTAKKSGHLVVVQHELRASSDKVEVLTTELWNSTDPCPQDSDLRRYYHAARAAGNKLACPNCECLHYVASGRR